jgi:gamma-glutamylcyclotransferase (GGCT)/AIG2-like uncharacterized protein YtfP
MSAGERVFVYGTLLPGGGNAHVAEAAGVAEAVPATVHGFRLYHLDPEGYPAVVPGPGVVHGAVLAVTGSLAPLDALEGIDLEPPLYRRVRCVPLGHREAWIYVYARPDRLGGAGVTWLPAGRWPIDETYET